MIEWKDDYKIGVDLIDEQHMKLFDIAGKAYELLRDDMSVDKYDDIINLIHELKDYTLFHFAAEEGFMQRIGYKKIFSQKIEHGNFIQKLNDISFDKIDEHQDEYVNGILDFVLIWISEHILENDKLIGQFISENNI